MPDVAERPLNESVVGSLEYRQSQVQKALSVKAPWGAESYCWVQATFDDHVIARHNGNDYKVPFTTDETTGYTFGTPELVVVEENVRPPTPLDTPPPPEPSAPEYAAPVNDSKEAPQGELLNEDLEEVSGAVTLELLNEEADKPKRYRLPVAQRADIINENRRRYRSEILAPAVQDLDRRAKRGELLMEDHHRVENGKNVRRVTQTVAKIGGVLMNEDGAVSLEEIEIIPTTAGKDIQALLEAKVPLRVSQRASGGSVLKHDEQGVPFFDVEKLQIDGFDFISPTEAGVNDPGNQLLLESKNAGGNEMPDGATPAETQNTGLNEAQIEAIVARMMSGNTTNLNEQQEALTAQQTALNEALEQNKKFLAEQEEQKQLAARRKTNEQLLNEALAHADLARFTKQEKEELRSLVPLEAETPEKLNESLQGAVGVLDRLLAASKLRNMGLNRPGITTTPIVTNEPLPNAEFLGNLNEAVADILSRERRWDKGQNDSLKKKLLARFDAVNMQGLLNESVTGVAADIPQVISTSRVIMEQAVPLLRAKDIADIGTMNAITEPIMIERWSAPLNAPLTEMMVGENGIAPTEWMKIVPYLMYATDRKIRTELTPESMAMASGMNYDLMAKSVAGLVKDYARRVDSYLFRVGIAAADMQDFYEVTNAWETLVRQGVTQEYASAHHSWVKWENFRKYNPETNQPTSILWYVGELTGSAHQKVQVRLGSSSTNLVRGFLQPSGAITVGESGTGANADYYVKYADGSIVLRSDLNPGNAAVQAKYTYTRNAIFWSPIPATGVTFNDHLINLKRYAGQAKTKIVNRYYQPTWQLASATIADMLSNSTRFTEAGGTASDVLNADNSIGRFSGLPVFDSVNFPDDTILYGTPDAIQHRVFKPFYLSPTHVDTETGRQSVIGIEFAGDDVPVPEKLSSVKIGGDTVGV